MLYNEPARGMDMVTLGLLGDSAHAQDVHVTGELTEHLFTIADPPHGSGTDLAAIDIMRGRDHGVPGQTSSIIIIIIVVVVVIVTVIEHYSVRQRDAFSNVS